MNTTKLVIGIMLIMTGIYLLIYTENPVIRYLGTFILAGTGLVVVYNSYKNS